MTELDTTQKKNQPSVELAVEDEGISAVLYPLIKDGVCDFCGVKFYGETRKGKEVKCKHYDGFDILCSYCRKKPETIETKGRTFYVYTVDGNNNKLVVTCDDYKCMDRHQRRAQKVNSI
ncbi:MAG: hypothetical protein KGN01_07145 [Patescibacteria group bacterium]|nr:hypothetical protein [Patescibacteria group bacterium]